VLANEVDLTLKNFTEQNGVTLPPERQPVDRAQLKNSEPRLAITNPRKQTKTFSVGHGFLGAYYFSDFHLLIQLAVSGVFNIAFRDTSKGPVSERAYGTTRRVDQSSSKCFYGIDIVGPRDSFWEFDGFVEHFYDFLSKLGVFGSEQQMETVPPSQSPQKTRCRSQKSVVSILLRKLVTNQLSHRLGRYPSQLTACAANFQSKCVGKGRIAKPLANREFILGKTPIVMVGCSHDSRMVWAKGLDYDPTRSFAPPCPSGYLSKKLKGSLRRAKVGQMKG
jgi:hypothetical protein